MQFEFYGSYKQDTIWRSTMWDKYDRWLLKSEVESVGNHRAHCFQITTQYVPYHWLTYWITLDFVYGNYVPIYVAKFCQSQLWYILGAHSSIYVSSCEKAGCSLQIFFSRKNLLCTLHHPERVFPPKNFYIWNQHCEASRFTPEIFHETCCHDIRIN